MSVATTVNRRPGRPSLSEQEKNAIRDNIISIARELFVTEGYEKTSMRKIAALAGFAPTKIYYYFDNKKAILRYFWEDIADELWHHCRPDNLSLQQDPLSQLRQLMERSVDYWLQNPKSYQLGIATQDFKISAEEHFNIYQTKGTKEYINHLRATVQKCIDQGIFKSTNMIRCSQLVSLSIYGIYGSFYGLPMVEWDSKEELIKVAINNTLEGLKHNPIS